MIYIFEIHHCVTRTQIQFTVTLLLKILDIDTMFSVLCICKGQVEEYVDCNSDIFFNYANKQHCNNNNNNNNIDNYNDT